jgi:hypothetical protein
MELKASPSAGWVDSRDFFGSNFGGFSKEFDHSNTLFPSWEGPGVGFIPSILCLIAIESLSLAPGFLYNFGRV